MYFFFLYKNGWLDAGDKLVSSKGKFVKLTQRNVLTFLLSLFCRK